MGGFFTISICLHFTQVVPRNFPDKAVENSDALPVWGARPGNFFALRQYLFTDLYAVDESVQDVYKRQAEDAALDALGGRQPELKLGLDRLKLQIQREDNQIGRAHV